MSRREEPGAHETGAQPAAAAPPAAPPRRAPHLFLFLGVFTLYLVFWAGIDGYVDLVRYLEMAEHLWLRGDLCQGRAPDGTPVPFVYAIGLPFVSGPFVLLGAAVDALTAGAIPLRRIVALTVPVLGALACLLLYKIGRRLSVPHAPSFAAAILLGLGSPMLTFVQFYYAETAVAFFVLLAVWAFLLSLARAGKARAGYRVLTGAGLAGITACHYANGATSLALWIVFVVAVLRDATADRRARLIAVATLSAVPLAAGAAILALNAAQYGGPFRTGYTHASRSAPAELAASRDTRPRPAREGGDEKPSLWYHDQPGASRDLLSFRLGHVPRSAPSVLYWLLRVPWIVPAVFFIPALVRRRRWIGLGVLAAAAAQLALWMPYGFTRFLFFVARFLLPLTALLAVPLVIAADRIWGRFRARGLVYAGGAALLWNVLFFLRGDIRWLQMSYWPDFGVTMQIPAWYMMQPTRMFCERHCTFFDIEPMWPSHWVTFCGLILVGSLFLFMAARLPGSDPLHEEAA